MQECLALHIQGILSTEQAVYSAMATVRHQVIIEYDDHAWKVDESMVKKVNDVEFVKLQPSRNVGFCRLLGVAQKLNPSVAQAPGIMKLTELRNAAQVDYEAAADAEQTATPLFQVPEKKRAKKSQFEQTLLKENPAILNVTVEDANVKMLAATHPQEAVWVECTDAALSACIEFIKSQGIDSDTRPYKTQTEPGAFRMGSGRIATKGSDGSLKYAKSE